MRVTLLLTALLVQPTEGGGASGGGGEGMAAFIAPSSDPSSFTYVQDFPVPVVGHLHEDFTDLPENSGELKLRVLCSSVNPSDRSTDDALKPKPLGSDVVGVVVESNSSVFKVGDVVWGDVGAVGELAAPTASSSTTTTTTKELGAYAEYVVALSSQLAYAPLESLPLLELCSLPKVALTMYKALTWYGGAPWNSNHDGSHDNDNVNSNDGQTRHRHSANSNDDNNHHHHHHHHNHNKTVLVLGGSGGTGSAGIQLAKAFGASRIAATASADNFAYCQGLGATEMIDYHTTDWWSVFAPGEVDVVLDTVGEKGTADRAFSVLSPHGGHVVTIADFSDIVPPSAVPAGMTFNAFINSDTNWASAPEMEAISGLVRSGQLAMPSLAVYGLDQTAEAFATSAAGHVVGKLVISVSNDTASASRGGGGGGPPHHTRGEQAAAAAAAAAAARGGGVAFGGGRGGAGSSSSSSSSSEGRGKVGAGGDPSGSWLSYVQYEAGSLITQMNVTVTVPSDPAKFGADPSFWYGLQTAQGDGALIQPILAWGQNGIANGWSIFHEVYDWSVGRDFRSPETIQVSAGDVLRQSVTYRKEDNSYDMYISATAGDEGGEGKDGGAPYAVIEWNYQLQAAQGSVPESAAFLVVEHQPRSCNQFPASGNVTFRDIYVEVDYEPVSQPAWVAQQEKPACASAAAVVDSATAVISWDPEA